MVNPELWPQHKERVLARLFDCRADSIPAWLSAQAQRCGSHYSGLLTTPEFEAALRSFTTRQVEPFELFVVGEGNFGKSTLINALLGDTLCKVHVLPETRTFYRFILSRNPAPTARLFARISRPEHDWLRRELGQGRPADGFFDVDEFHVRTEQASDLLAREAEIAKREKERYVPAIFELEQEIQWTPSSRFPERVRIVDTQGLNQQLPEDLLQALESDRGEQTPDYVLKWLHQTVRGRHLLWQYRRCDAALWLLHAGVVQSAATNVLFPIFSSYGKKTVFVITNTDRLDPSERNTVLSCARAMYGHCTDAIVPVNGRLAVKGALERSEELERSSGIDHLRAVIQDLCVVRGLQTRAMGMYNALRTTETDMRTALIALRGQVGETLVHLRDHNLRLETLTQTAVEDFEKAIAAAGKTSRESLDERIRTIGFTDDGSDADRKIAFSQLCVEFQKQAQQALQQTEHAIGELIREMEREPYTLPTFDSRGDRAGTSVFVNARVAFERFPIRIVVRRVALKAEYFSPLLSNLKRLFGRWFSDRMKREAERDLEEMRKARWSHAHEQCDPEFEDLARLCADTGRKDIRSGLRAVEAGLRELEKKLTSVENESLEETGQRLDRMLASRVVHPVLAARGVAAFRAARAKSKSHSDCSV